MDRKTRLQVEESFEKHGGLFVPTENGNIFIPKKARVLEGGGPRVKENWGEDIRLEAGIVVLSKDGKVKEDREWDSKSFVRWFSRIMQSYFDNASAGVTDFQSTGTAFYTGSGNSQNPQWRPSTASGAGFGLPGGQFAVGASLGFGNGAFSSDSGRVTLVNLLYHQNAYIDVITTQDDTAALSYFITTGITLATVGSTTISEMGLFTKIRNPFTGQAHLILMAYDEVSPGVVAAYGDVVAPKYTMTFAA